MKNIRKNRLLLWAIWLVPISVCGIAWGGAWTLLQFLLYRRDKQEREKSSVPLWKDPEVIKLNPDIELTEDYNGLVNIGSGTYCYQRNRKAGIRYE